MKQMFLKAFIITISIIFCTIESSESPTNKQKPGDSSEEKRLKDFLASFSKPEDFLKPLDELTGQEIFNSGYKRPALFDIIGYKGNKQIIEMLLQKNPDLRVIRNQKGENLFHWLAYLGPSANMRLLIAYCKTQQYNLPEILNTSDHSRVRPLHLAAQGCKTSCLKVLIENGADLDAQDFGGWTPLHYAVATNVRGNKKRDKTVKLLCEAGANKAILDRSVQNAREIALSLSRDETACLILTTNEKS